MAASVVGLCKTVPIREKGPWRDLGRLDYAALEYVDWFSHRRPRPPKPNASPCLPPPSPPGTPPTSVQLSTTVYQHINLHRRYDVTNTTTPPPGQLRPLTAAQTDAFCTDAGSTPTSCPVLRTSRRWRLWRPGRCLSAGVVATCVFCDGAEPDVLAYGGEGGLGGLVAGYEAFGDGPELGGVVGFV